MSDPSVYVVLGPPEFRIPMTGLARGFILQVAKGSHFKCLAQWILTGTEIV